MRLAVSEILNSPPSTFSYKSVWSHFFPILIIGANNNWNSWPYLHAFMHWLPTIWLADQTFSLTSRCRDAANTVSTECTETYGPKALQCKLCWTQKSVCVGRRPVTHSFPYILGWGQQRPPGSGPAHAAADSSWTLPPAVRPFWSFVAASSSSVYCSTQNSSKFDYFFTVYLLYNACQQHWLIN